MKKKRDKEKRRLGSRRGGLSLEAFALAKSKPRFNPAEIRRKREYYENAKKVRKYKKLIKNLPSQDIPVAQDSSQQAPEILEKERTEEKEHEEKEPAKVSGRNTSSKQPFLRQNHKSRSRNELEILREGFVRKQQEVEKLKLEREEMLKAKEEARLRAIQTRKDMKAKMFKKTKTGQPVMKHRLRHILEALQQAP